MPENRALKVDIKEFVIANYSREYMVDIRRECIQFNVYQDLYSPVMSFTATLKDSNGLIERFPFVGEETIGIIFKNSDNTKKTFKRIFNVYKIANRKTDNERAESYTIHGISYEARANVNMAVDRSFLGLPFSSIVGSVYDEYFVNNTLRNGLKLEKNYIPEVRPIFIEDTYGAHSVVAPLSSPFDFIAYCARQAQSSTYIESDFVFYEDTDGYNFRTVSSLIDIDPVEDYYDGDASIDTPDIKKYQMISNLEYGESEFDALKSQQTGMYDNEVSVLDPVLKRFVHQPFNYHFAMRDREFKGLGKEGFTTEYSTERTLDGGSHGRFLVSNYSDGDYKTTSYINGRTIDRHGNILDPVSHFPFSRHKTLNFRVSKMSQMNTRIIMKVTIPGDVNRKVGDVVRIFIPQRSGVQEFKQRYNLFYGEKDPKFLITGLKHIYNFDDDTYYTVMEVMKDSLGQQLVQTKRFSESEVGPRGFPG